MKLFSNILLLVAACCAAEARADTAEARYECRVTDSAGKTVVSTMAGPVVLTSDLFSVLATSESDAATKAIAAANKAQANTAVAACCREKVMVKQLSKATTPGSARAAAGRSLSC